MIAELAMLFSGIALLAYCSERGVEHAASIATTFGVPTLVVGVILVSVGTDLPELTNSIVSSAMGHGDLNVGDSLGSCLAQISLVMGLVGVVVGELKIDREEILELGRGELMGLLLATFFSKSNYISRLDAALLIFGYFLLLIALRHYLLKNYRQQKAQSISGVHRHLLMFFIYMAGVALGSYLTITSAIALSKEIAIPEYIVGFFAIAIGTSLPELAVDITAARKKQYALAIGDIIGSNIVDSTLSIAIGPLISPVSISGGLAFATGVWAFIVSLIVLLTLGLRGRLDQKAGVFFIAIYLSSYALIFMT